MARDSLSIDSESGIIAGNGTTGYFINKDRIEIQRLGLAPWETILGPKCIVSW